MLLIVLCLIIMIALLSVGSLLLLLKRLPQGQTKDLAWQLQALEQNLKVQQTELSNALKHSLADKLAEQQLLNIQASHQLKDQLQAAFASQREQLAQYQTHSLQMLADNLQKGRTESIQQVQSALQHSSQQLVERLDKLTQVTEGRLKDISGQVEKRLNEGFEKTNATFSSILQRLALIDEAQKKMTELSSNVVNLKDLLADKRSRGAFGEVQLSALIRNVIPESHFGLQVTLSNTRRADCVLYLPKPTGDMVIDAKFPLENFRRLSDIDLTEDLRKQAEVQFKRDLKQHIDDISQKYIIPGETADSAIMFIPAESIFAEIHAHHADVLEYSYKARVWLASPTTMMAILTTVRAVLKDEATRQQVHVIQAHLRALGKDFERFQKRMDGLQRHIQQANEDVQDVNTSAKKITRHFDRIDKVELGEAPDSPEALLKLAED